MSEKIHLNAEQKAEQIKAVREISELLPKLTEKIMCLHTKACIVAFQSSLENITKKCELYSKEKIDVSPDEKRVMRNAAKKALEDFRAQKKNDAVSATGADNATETDEPIVEVSTEEFSEVKHESKKKKRG